MTGEQRAGDGSVITVVLTGAADETATDLLTKRISHVIERLVAAAAEQAGGVVLSIEDHSDGVSRRALREAFVSACRALVQGFVREEGSSIPPVNIVVSDGADHGSRDDALDYLLGADGGFARGTLLDLRRTR